MKIIIRLLLSILFLTTNAKAFEIIRDTELEQFTFDIVSNLLDSNKQELNELNIYFIQSDQINAFVTGGKNIFINSELIISADDYREYAAVLAHEIAHIQGGHIFNTSIEINNLSEKALPIYLLGIIGVMTGSSDAGIAGVMVGQASINDGFTYYSRTQEASADQSAVRILCNSGIDGHYLINFLNKLKAMEINKFSEENNYRSTHPLTDNRITWIESSLKSYKQCNYENDNVLEKRFNLLKAKLYGFTHSYEETDSVYQGTDEKSLYAKAVSSYLRGDHEKSIENINELISSDPSNPFYKELLGEIYYANSDYAKASNYQKRALDQIEKVNDLYLMMMGNYLLSFEHNDSIHQGISYLKRSIQINPKNAYSWYLLARAYAMIDNLPLANYATAERYFLIGDRSLSYNFAVKAIKNIEEFSPEWYRSSDLIKILEKEVSIN
jgi:predicted Zn-dependent protease